MDKRLKNGCIIKGYEWIPYWLRCLYRLQLTIFTDSPDAGDPECICSLCTYRIEEDEVPIRLWSKLEDRSGKQFTGEARLHEICFRFMQGETFTGK